MDAKQIIYTILIVLNLIYFLLCVCNAYKTRELLQYMATMNRSVVKAHDARNFLLTILSIAINGAILVVLNISVLVVTQLLTIKF